MNKIFGYLLLCVGLLMIFFSVLSMYKVFADRQPVAPVVQMKDMQIATQYGPMQIPMQAVNTLANVGLFAVFMLFILGAGGRVAGVGVNMIKMERLREALLLSRQKIEDETLKKL
ncbi:MAG: hypothetical protein IJP25_04405 [Elusimicrobiaceae bacterium]|jgi:hypothetical protein|nr:hypothetical protein [Elusimicrobiaceae bacterium]